MKNILIPRINYSPLYHHVDWLQEQIFNTKNISSNPHDKRKPSTKFPRPRDFFCLHALFSRNFTVYLPCYVIVRGGGLDGYDKQLEILMFYILLDIQELILNPRPPFKLYRLRISLFIEIPPTRGI